MATRTGKIARLPHPLREEVCRRLFDGQTAPVILPWLNAQGEAIRIWEAHFKGVPASDENLSQWRQGGYEDWLKMREKADHLKSLSEHAVNIAKSGGNKLSAAAQSVLAGNILETMEILISANEGDEEPDDPVGRISKLAGAVTMLRNTDIAALNADTAQERLSLEKKKVTQKDRQLDLDEAKFETQTVAKFLEWAKSPEATAILDSGKPKQVQMDELRTLLFGTRKGETA